MSLSGRDIQQLALDNLENQKREIDAQIAELQNRMGESSPKRKGLLSNNLAQAHEPVSVKNVRKRRKMSAAQKRIISAKLKQRWAERKRQSG